MTVIAVLVEATDAGITPASAAGIALARKLGEPVVVAAGPLSGESLDAVAAAGAGSVVLAPPSATGGSTDADALARMLPHFLENEKVSVLVAAPTVWGREVHGRVAVLTGAPVLSGVTDARQTQTGLMLTAEADGGNRSFRASVSDPLVLVLTAVTLLAPIAEGPEMRPVVRTLGPMPDLVPRVIVEHVEAAAGEPAAPLARATIVVGAGRGMGSAAAVQDVREWAESVGATFGASRGPVEAGWTPFDRLIGQTGSTIAPDLYIAFGVSGAPQHLAGVRHAGTIVAVNIDASAPMLDEADVAIVGDARAVLGLLTRRPAGADPGSPLRAAHESQAADG